MSQGIGHKKQNNVLTYLCMAIETLVCYSKRNNQIIKAIIPTCKAKLGKAEYIFWPAIIFAKEIKAPMKPEIVKAT